MPDYAKLYHLLFNAITNTLTVVDPASTAADLLRQAQQDAEECYVSAEF